MYGGIFPQNKGGCYSIIYTYDPIEKRAVYADTVGQYTGLTDKNGMKIFEGDIVHIHDALLQSCEPYHEFDGYVDFSDGAFRVVGLDGAIHYRWLDYDVTITGNVHDNPELLKGGGQP